MPAGAKVSSLADRHSPIDTCPGALPTRRQTSASTSDDVSRLANARAGAVPRLPPAGQPEGIAAIGGERAARRARSRLACACPRPRTPRLAPSRPARQAHAHCWSPSSAPAASGLVSLGGPRRCMPLTISSMRRSMLVISTAVLTVCCFTTSGSQTPSSRMSARTPFSPSMPQAQAPVAPAAAAAAAAACLARSSVTMRTTSQPQFCARVRGITSKACAAAL
mmetsp:Transcript_17104/g.49579  ORF Transcript_17104/g.49579 Transcript_17104/m.49579 type:complete len:222 (+) Transcript_17104:168-833(+)